MFSIKIKPSNNFILFIILPHKVKIKLYRNNLNEKILFLFEFYKITKMTFFMLDRPYNCTSKSI